MKKPNLILDLTYTRRDNLIEWNYKISEESKKYITPFKETHHESQPGVPIDGNFYDTGANKRTSRVALNITGLSYDALISMFDQIEVRQAGIESELYFFHNAFVKSELALAEISGIYIARVQS